MKQSYLNLGMSPIDKSGFIEELNRYRKAFMVGTLGTISLLAAFYIGYEVGKFYKMPVIMNVQSKTIIFQAYPKCAEQDDSSAPHERYKTNK